MFKVVSNLFNLSFEMNRRITILSGDSGVGKTVLVSVLQAYANNAEFVNVTLPASITNVVIVNNTVWKQVIPNSYNSLIVFDDDSSIEDPEFYSLLGDSLVENNNYCLLIYRGELDDGWKQTVDTRVPLSIDSIFELKFLGNHDYEFTPKFPGCYDVSSVTTLITEDSKSGYQFFKYNFEVNVIPAGSNSNIVNLCNAGNHQYVVLDRANFGIFAPKLYNMFPKIRVIPNLECFEELLLNTNLVSEFDESDKINWLSYERFYENLVSVITTGKPYHMTHGMKLKKCYYQTCDECNLFQNVGCDSALVGSKIEQLLINTKYEYLLGIPHKGEQTGIKKIQI